MALQAARDRIAGGISNLRTDVFGGTTTVRNDFASTSITEGEIGGVNTTFGQLGNIYEWYFNTVLNQLQTSIPIAPLWLCFFTDLPEKDRKNALIYAQAVQIVGDGITPERVGIEHQGQLKGVISNGRKDLDALKISFLETNFSFTDGFLRNEMKHHSIHGLRGWAPDLVVFQFGKTGSPDRGHADGNRLSRAPFRVRQVTTYHRVRPVDIATQELNYDGDAIIRRDVSFVFDHYEIIPDEMFSLDAPAVFNRSVKVMQESVQRGLLGRAQDKIGEKVPLGVGDSINNTLNQTLGILRAGADSVVSNVINTPQALADRAGQAIQQRVAGATQGLTNKINAGIQGAQDKITGLVGLDPAGQVKIAQDDTPSAFIRQYNTVDNADIPVEFRSQLQPTVDHKMPFDHRFQHVQPPESDVPERTGGDRTTDAGVLGALAGKREDSAKQMSKDAADTPLFFGSTDYGYPLKVPQNDTPPFPLRHQNQRPPADDVGDGKQVSWVHQRAGQQDVTPGKRVSPQIVNTPSNDTVDSQSIPVQIVTVKK